MKIFNFKFNYLLAALSFLSFILTEGCASLNSHENANPAKTITQVSTIDALLSGVYNGSLSGAELLRHGDTGIGTFDALDGEMIILNGVIYQAKADGKIYIPDPYTLKTPFASVSGLNRTSDSIYTHMPQCLNSKDLENAIDNIFPNRNIFVCFTVEASFESIKVRSVPAQKKPYRPLTEVTKNQPEFTYTNIRGTLVGFRCPPFVKGVNVPGYHIHFISEDLKYGGHLLSMKTAKDPQGIIHAADFTCFYMILPSKSKEFEGADLKKDRSAELNKAEK